MQTVHSSSRLCVNGHIQAGRGCKPLTAEYLHCQSNGCTLHNLLALNIYFLSFVGYFCVTSYLQLLGSDILNEFALCVHYLFPYVFLIYALGHKVEVDWKKMLRICTKEQC